CYNSTMCNETQNTNYKPKYEMQDIFKLYGDDYIARYKLTTMQLKAIRDISDCRTSSLGYNASECNDCKNIEFAYNSCRNRNCPKCQGDKRYDWIEKRLETTLDTPYYHTVFTVPNQLFEIAIYNQSIFYNILFQSASDTLKLFAQNLKWWDVDETLYKDKQTKVNLAFFGILHSWGQTLVYHPHIHFVVAGGGIIDNSLVQPKYNSKFLFPVKAMSKVFRGIFVAKLKRTYYAGSLEVSDELKDSRLFENHIDNLVSRKWVIYMKSQFKSSAKIVEYMARYTHKSAISNSRIISIDNNTISFKYKDYKDSSKHKIMKLSSDEFIRRFLYHIPPKRFFRIRYYGVIQKLKKLTNIKTINIQPQNKQLKPKCKKCSHEDIQTVVVVDRYKKVVQGLLTPAILIQKEEIGFYDSG
ncbi:Transposase, partial [hydrothermal vent metagenome]